jgi:hypothetical protein
MGRESDLTFISEQLGRAGCDPQRSSLLIAIVFQQGFFYA